MTWKKGESGNPTGRFVEKQFLTAETMTAVGRRRSAQVFLDPDGKRIITCHGPKGIYGALVDTVAVQWPDEAAS